MKFVTALAGALALLASAAQAQTCPLVNPVPVIVGQVTYLTPRDQSCAALPMANCSFSLNYPAGTAAAPWIKEATRFAITGVTAGTIPNVRMICSGTQSDAFSILVAPPPPPPPPTVVTTTSP